MQIATLKSKTINYAHIQTILGAVTAGIAVLNPQMFSEAPVWVYPVLLGSGAAITYYLRTVTTKALSEK